MLLGISSYSFPWAVSAGEPGRLTAKGLIDFAFSNHIEFVQFGDNLPLHQLDRTGLAQLKKHADKSNVKIQVGTRGLRAENIERHVQIAKQLGSPFIRIVIDDNGFYPEATEVIEIIRSLLPLLEESRIILAIENHDRFPASVLESIILSTDPHWIGVCLDTANSLGAGEGIHEVVEVLAPYTINLHVKDFSIRRVDHKMGFHVEGTAAGEGMLDLVWLLDRLAKTGKCDTATLELWIEPESGITQTLMKEKLWVNKSLQHLKKIIK